MDGNLHRGMPALVEQGCQGEDDGVTQSSYLVLLVLSLHISWTQLRFFYQHLFVTYVCTLTMDEQCCSS